MIVFGDGGRRKQLALSDRKTYYKVSNEVMKMTKE